MRMPNFIFVAVSVLLSLSGLAQIQAQTDETGPRIDLLRTLLTWAPMLLIVGVWVYFMRNLRRSQPKAAQRMERLHRHMDEVERQLARIVSILERQGPSR